MTGSSDARGVYVGELGLEGAQRLFDADTAAVYVAPGYLLYARQGALFAQRFDASRAAVTGDPFVFSEQISIDSVTASMAAVSTAANGSILYRAGTGSGQRQFTWVDRSGKTLSTVGDRHDGLSPSWSPDGRRVALHRTGAASGNLLDVWILELERGAFTRFTSNPSFEIYPVWSPDGMQIVFSSNRNGVYDLYRKAANGSGTEDVVLPTPQLKNPTDWSPDGRFILYRTLGKSNGRATTFGPFRSTAIASRFPSRRPNSKSATASSRQTARGSPINPTSRGGSKSTCSRFPAPAAGCKCPRTAARRCDGGETGEGVVLRCAGRPDDGGAHPD